MTRYRRTLADDYPDFARHHIFLSPGGVPANLKRDQKHWQPVGYSVIRNAVQEILESGVEEPNANNLLQIYATGSVGIEDDDVISTRIAPPPVREGFLLRILSPSCA